MPNDRSAAQKSKAFGDDASPEDLAGAWEHLTNAFLKDETRFMGILSTMLRLFEVPPGSHVELLLNGVKQKPWLDNIFMGCSA